MVKYITYCRKSTDEKEKQVLSIEQQLAELKEFAEKEKLEVIDYLTEAKTAKKPGREKFEHLLKLIQRGKANGIIAWHPDRLARNTIDGGKIVYLLDTGQLQSLKFPNFWFENTPQGRFVLNIAFGQAKYFSDNLSENVKRGLRHKIRMGVWPARAPLGYRNDKNTKTVVIDPNVARPIKQAFRKFASGESSMADISNFFFENGIKRINGRPMEVTTIRRILIRPFYCGLMKYRGEIYEGIHKPIISKKLYDQVQKVLEKTWRQKPRKYNFPFTGFIKCVECGAAITAERQIRFFPRTRGKVEYIYYRCTRKKGPCTQPFIRAEELEGQIQKLIESVSLSKTWANKMLALLEKDAEKEKQLAKQKLQKLTFSLDHLEKKLDKLLEAYLEEIIDTQNYQKKKNELMEEKLVLENKISEIKEKGSLWLEPMREFINCALRAQKIARAKNNSHLLAQMAKKVGSNYLLENERLEFSLLLPYKMLAARGGAAGTKPRPAQIIAFGNSKLYIDNLRVNTQRGLRQKVRQGEYPGLAPIGYLNDVRNKTIIVDKKKAPVVKKCFELYARGVYKLWDVSHFLADQGIKSRGKKPIHPDSIKFMLSNPFYIGLFRYKGEVYEGIHEPLISKKLFDEVQNVLEDRSHPQSKRHSYPFTGLIRCGECGYMITAETQRTHIYYRCTKRSKVQKCFQPYVRQEELLPQINDLLQKVSLSPSEGQYFFERLDREEKDIVNLNEAAAKELKEEVSELDQKLNFLVDSYLDQVIDRPVYLERKSKIVKQKKTFEDKLIRLSQQPDEWFEQFREWVKSTVGAAKIANNDTDLQVKASFLKGVGSNIVLKDRRLYYDPKQNPRNPYLLLLRSSRDGQKRRAGLAPRPPTRNLADPTGFEPAIFCSTGRHVNRYTTGPRLAPILPHYFQNVNKPKTPRLRTKELRAKALMS